jgi:hypothetical protein
MNAPLKLFLHGLDYRFIKTMMAFLQGPCQGAAMVVASPIDANIDLYDADSYASKKLLESALETPLLRPVIVLSLQDYHEKRVFFLKKPIEANGLQAILAKTRRFTPESPNPAANAGLDHSETSEKAGQADDLDLLNDDLYAFMAQSAWGNSPVPTIPVPIAALQQTEAVAVEAEIEAEVEPSLENQGGVIAEVKIENESETDVNASGVVTTEESPNPETDAADADDVADRYEATADAEATTTKDYLRELERSKTTKHLTAIRLDEKSYRTAIGLVDERTFVEPGQLARASYGQKEFFQGCFQAAWSIARMKNQPLMLNSPWCQIALFPRSQEVWLTANDTEISTIACIRLRPKDITDGLSIKPVDANSADIKNALDKFQSSEAFIWKLACWTSKGRFPHEIDLAQPVYLKHWPNFTRLLITPHALRISALLVQGPRTMDNVARVLGINPQYVFIFISAAHAIGVAGQAKRLTDTLFQPPEIQATRKQGLFGEIMNKLRG